MDEMKYVDTVEAGAGSYPEPPETEDKEYVFTCECSTKMEISITATNYEDALRYIEEGDYNDLYIINHEVQNVLGCEIQD